MKHVVDDVPAQAATWRRVPDLLIEVDDTTGIQVSSAHATRRLKISRAALELLLSENLEARTKAEAVCLAELAKHGFIVDADQPESALKAPWDTWGTLLREVHVRADQVQFYRRGTPKIAEWHNSIHDLPKPPPTALTRAKSNTAVIFLPRTAGSSPARSFDDVLGNRRSHRSFESRGVSLDVLSTILRAGFGPLRFQDTGEYGTVQLRAPMGAGARNEAFPIVFAFSVEGLEPAAYVYDEVRHALIAVADGDMRSQLESATAEQGFNEACAFNIVVTSDAADFAWKYRHPRAYRMLMNDIGAIAQVVGMTAESLSLGCATTAAISVDEISSLVPLADEREMPLISLAIGHPRKTVEGLPLDHRPGGVHG
jgi:SagB-type dehydrogenase family enzyme